LKLTPTGIEKVREGGLNYAIHQNDKIKGGVRESLEVLTQRVKNEKNRGKQLSTFATIARDHGMDALATTMKNLDEDTKQYFQQNQERFTERIGGSGKGGRQGGFVAGDLLKAATGDTEAKTRVQTVMTQKALRDYKRAPTSDLQTDLHSSSETRVIAAASELLSRGEYDAVRDAGLSQEQVQRVQKIAPTINLTNENKDQNDRKNSQYAVTMEEIGQALTDNTVYESVVARSEQAAHTSIQNQFLQKKNKTIDIERAIQTLKNERTDGRTARGIVSSILNASNGGEQVLRERIESGEITSLNIDNDLNKHIQTKAGEQVDTVIERIAQDIDYDNINIVLNRHPNLKDAPDHIQELERTQTTSHDQYRGASREADSEVKQRRDVLNTRQEEYEKIKRVAEEDIRSIAGQMEEVRRTNRMAGIAENEGTHLMEERINERGKEIARAEKEMKKAERQYTEASERAAEANSRRAEVRSELERTRRGEGGEDDDRGSGGSGPTPTPIPDPDPTPLPPPSVGGDDKPPPSTPPEVYRQPNRAVRRYNNRTQREIITEETERDALREDTQRTQETPPQTPTQEGHRRANENLQTKPRQQGIRTARKQANERRREWERADREHDRREAQQEQEGPLRERVQQAQEQLQREERERDEKEYKEWAENEVLNQEIAEEEQWEREEKRQELERKEQERKKDLKEYTERLDREKEERERELERREREFREQGREEARREAQKLTNQNREEQEERQRQEEEERRDAVERSQPQRKSDSDTERSRKRQDARRRKQSPNRNQDDDENGTQQPRSRRSDRRRRRRERDLQNQQEAQENNGLEPYEDMAQDFMQDEWDDN